MSDKPAGLSPAQARARRESMLQVASFLDSVSGTESEMPNIDWDTFDALPPWAMKDERSLKRLVLVTGALYAAPSLRLCLDARLLRTLTRLIGRHAMQAVLDSRDLPDSDPDMVSGEFDPNQFFARSAALLVAGVENQRMRAAMSVMLGASKNAAASPLRPLTSASVMAERAHAILHAQKALEAERAAAKAAAAAAASAAAMSSDATSEEGGAQ